MWSGVEPEENMINETYIGVLKEIISGLENHGVYSYLDMHQDVMNNVATYDGVPQWLYDKFEAPDHEYPWPMKDTSGYSTWACGYFTQEISHGFQELYTKHQLEFARVWREIAARFRDMSAVLGYELMNEPWTGNFYEDLSVLLPGNAGHELLEPFFNATSDAIREVDDETLIFWEPVTYAYFVNTEANIILDTILDTFMKSQNYTVLLPIIREACGDLAEDLDQVIESVDTSFASLLKRSSQSELSRKPSVLGPGFSAPPGGPDYLNRTVMSYHYYCWALGYAGDEETDPVLSTLCDEVLGPVVFNTVSSRAAELGGSATMLTEFGECNPDFEHPDEAGSTECRFVLDEADKHLQSWSYWDAAGGGILWDGEGNIKPESVKVFSRPYAPATAGTPTSLHYDQHSRVMTFTFLPNLQILQPTEVFIPGLVYDQGFSVTVSDNLSWEHHLTNQNKILIYAHEEEEASVRIDPK